MFNILIVFVNDIFISFNLSTKHEQLLYDVFSIKHNLHFHSNLYKESCVKKSYFYFLLYFLFIMNSLRINKRAFYECLLLSPFKHSLSMFDNSKLFINRNHTCFLSKYSICFQFL